MSDVVSVNLLDCTGCTVEGKFYFSWMLTAIFLIEKPCVLQDLQDQALSLDAWARFFPNLARFSGHYFLL